jgi:hypothetical protein
MKDWKATTVVSFFARVAVAFLLNLGFVFASDNGSATIRIIKALIQQERLMD